MEVASVVVESRDLDTDARERSTHEVAAPRDAYQEHRRLIELVAGTHPGAKPRTFANGAATFLGRQHLIVAFYADRSRARITRPAPAAPSAGEQHQLFEP